MSISWIGKQAFQDNEAAPEHEMFDDFLFTAADGKKYILSLQFGDLDEVQWDGEKYTGGYGINAFLMDAWTENTKDESELKEYTSEDITEDLSKQLENFIYGKMNENEQQYLDFINDCMEGELKDRYDDEDRDGDEGLSWDDIYRRDMQWSDFI